MSPSRPISSSTTAFWNVTVRSSAFANAAVIRTSDMQLPDRDANASEALRVNVESYSSLSWLFV